MSEYYSSSETIDDIGVDLSYVEQDNAFEPIPNGDYLVQATEVKVARSKSGNRMLNVQFQVVTGRYENRRIFESYNIEHTNTKVCEIALRQIKSWVLAVGMTGNERLTMELLNQLCGREFIASIKIEEDKTGQYEPKNRIRSYKPQTGTRSNASNNAVAASAVSGQSNNQPTQQQARQAPQQRPPSNARPWETGHQSQARAQTADEPF